MSLHYSIKVNKDHSLAKATWDVTVDMSDTELISSFALTVEGKALNTQCNNPTGGGNKACKGADFVTLSNPNDDCAVTFVITTNKPDVQDGNDVLRGDKTYDDVDFAD
jgi:chitodextrinase